MDALGLVRLVGGSLLLAFVPGYVWTRILLPRLSRIETLVVGVTLSIASLVLLLYLGNIVFGIPIKPATALLDALALTAAGLAVPLARRLRSRLDRETS